MWAYGIIACVNHKKCNNSFYVTLMYGLLITELNYQLQTKQVYTNTSNSSPLVYANAAKLYEARCWLYM